MYVLRRFLVGATVVVACWFALTALHKHLDPNKSISDEESEDALWIATSKHWLDRQACRWIGICGIAHWHPDPAVRQWKQESINRRLQQSVGADKVNWKHIIGDPPRLRPGDWDGDSRVLKEVPQFVLDAAPLVHLYSGEQFWPSDIVDHLKHTMPYLNYTSMNLSNAYHTAENLHALNEGHRGRHLFMQSKEDVEDRPEWLGSAYNKPVPYNDDEEDDDDMEYTETINENADQEDWFDAFADKKTVAKPVEYTFRKQGPIKQSGGPSYRALQEELRKRNPTLTKPGGYSPAPAVLVLVDKGQGILDAFWFYFYSYNLGTTVLGIRFGNHVGDWEHSLIRFHNGVPKAVFFSAHSGGLAYTYNAVEKGQGEGREGRPVIYSATGSHAMYATPGSHPYILPFGLLADVTDKGPLWDPAQNYYAYHFNTSVTHDMDARMATTNAPEVLMQETLQPAADTPTAPLGWWWYKGHWGDKFYQLRDWRQWRFVGQYHYVNGPLGPRYKNLGRSRVCQSRGPCTIVKSLEAGRKKSWTGKR